MSKKLRLVVDVAYNTRAFEMGTILEDATFVTKAPLSYPSAKA